MSPTQLPGDAIRDTVAAVFRAPVYNRTSLLEIIGSWLRDHLAAFLLRLGPGRVPAPLFWFFILVTLLVVAGALARVAAIMVRERTTRRAAAAAGTSTEPGDAWAAARRLAAAGDYTAAAHALYAAILDVIARRDAVELHESKTIGDYARDLAGRSSAMLTRFREFARDYEVVIYGMGNCDRDRYERLDGLAFRILESGV